VDEPTSTFTLICNVASSSCSSRSRGKRFTATHHRRFSVRRNRPPSSGSTRVVAAGFEVKAPPALAESIGSQFNLSWRRLSVPRSLFVERKDMKHARPLALPSAL